MQNFHKKIFICSILTSLILFCIIITVAILNHPQLVRSHGAGVDRGRQHHAEEEEGQELVEGKIWSPAEEEEVKYNIFMKELILFFYSDLSILFCIIITVAILNHSQLVQSHIAGVD